MRKFLIRRRKRKQSEIAKERIEELFSQADKSFKDDSGHANRYVLLARKVAMRTNVRFTKKQARMFCKHCNAYLMPGFNCRVRTREGKLVYTCLECGKSSRMPYLREKKASS